MVPAAVTAALAMAATAAISAMVFLRIEDVQMKGKQTDQLEPGGASAHGAPVERPVRVMFAERDIDGGGLDLAALDLRQRVAQCFDRRPVPAIGVGPPVRKIDDVRAAHFAVAFNCRTQAVASAASAS